MSPLAAPGFLPAIPDPEHECLEHPILAAGAVLMRPAPGGVEIACVHRPRYDDWSLPKGKVDPGETIPQAAARELVEETGHQAQLSSLLGTTSYTLGGRNKMVYYFTATALGGQFVPNREVDEVVWLTPEEAMRQVTYDLDREVIRAALAQPQATSRILVVRHAKALGRQQWVTKDSVRPLSKKGRRQAELLAPMLAAFHPTAVLSSPAVRCKDTAKPLAKALGLKVGKAVLPDLDTHTGVTVLVLHKPDVLALLRKWGATAEPALREALAGARAPRASTWVLDIAGGAVVGAAFLASAEPAK